MQQRVAPKVWWWWIVRKKEKKRERERATSVDGSHPQNRKTTTTAIYTIEYNRIRTMIIATFNQKYMGMSAVKKDNIVSTILKKEKTIQ